MTEHDRINAVMRARSKRDSWTELAGLSSAGLFLAVIFVPTFGLWPVAVPALGFALGMWRSGVWHRRSQALDGELTHDGGEAVHSLNGGGSPGMNNPEVSQ